VAKAVQWLQEHYQEDLRVGTLAEGVVAAVAAA